MKIAILSCNNFSIFGGAERFIIDIASALDADIISYGSITDVNSYLVKLPSHPRFIFLNRHLPPEPLKQLFGSILFRTITLPKYDFYVVMDDIAIHAIKKSTPHLYYMFTPRRALYDMKHITIKEKKSAIALIYSTIIPFLKFYDRHTVAHIKNIASISNNVRNRIFKTYIRNSSVIYPCIHTSLFSYSEPSKFWLSVSRIDKWKRIDLQIEAFRQMPDRILFIVGTVYPSMEHLLKNCPPNVQFLGTIPDSKLIDLYSRCIGFITTAIDEDFGITPLEAMASGKPVIAAKEGGYLETVIDGHTGMLITPTIPSLISAVITISESPHSYKDACIAQAKKFDYSVFKKEITHEINKHIPKTV